MNLQEASTMTEFTSMLSEPGFWVLCSLVVFASISLAASVLMRAKRRALLQLVSELVSEPHTRADRAWLRYEIGRSKGGHLLFAAPFAPFAILGAIAIGAYEGWAAKGRSYDDHVSVIKRETEEIQVRTIELVGSVKLSDAKLWSDPRRKQVFALASAIGDWNNPISMLWISFWLLAASPLLLIGYFVMGSTRPFLVNVWPPLREPVATILNQAHVA
jgi:hypothetical protein